MKLNLHSKAVLTARVDNIQAAKKRKRTNDAFELSASKLSAAGKAKWRAWLLNVPRHVKLVRAIWDAPNKKELTMAQYYGLRRTGLTQEQCAIIVAQSILRPGTLNPPLTLAEMRHRLHAQPDFAQVQTLLQDLHEKLGTEMTYAPKYHCELQEMAERAWGQAKEQARRH